MPTQSKYKDFDCYNIIEKIVSFFDSTGDASETEVDTVLLLTAECYLVAEYDSNLDKVVRFEKVPLDDITEIELGWFQYSKIFQITPTPQLCLRINYSMNGMDQYYHMLRSASIRFFNNVAVVIKAPEEIMGWLTFHSCLFLKNDFSLIRIE